MEDKVKCPNCHKVNDIQKFCIYCGGRLLDDYQIKMLTGTPEPYCLNCGRLVEIGKRKCECGYEFADIKCPECGADNEYTNKFCISCGEKLWKSSVSVYKYTNSIFERRLFKSYLPHECRNIPVFERLKNELAWDSEKSVTYDSLNTVSQPDVSLNRLKSEEEMVDKNLYEICSRWRIVSPYHCISCLEMHNGVCSCMTPYLTNNRRIKFLQSEKNYYTEPRFEDDELKWTSKSKPESYLSSLAPAIGESQLEYRERLKWDFVSNVDRKEKLRNSIDNLTRTIKQKNSKPSTFSPKPKEKYCSINCIHYYEEFLDSGGGIVGDFDSEGYVEYYCNLGHTIVDGRFCEDYES